MNLRQRRASTSTITWRGGSYSAHFNAGTLLECTVLTARAHREEKLSK